MPVSERWKIAVWPDRTIAGIYTADQRVNRQGLSFVYVVPEAEVTKLQGAVVEAVVEQERLRAELRTAARRMRDAHALLTPGMKAGTGEARAILADAAANAR